MINAWCTIIYGNNLADTLRDNDCNLADTLRDNDCNPADTIRDNDRPKEYVQPYLETVYIPQQYSLSAITHWQEKCQFEEKGIVWMQTLSCMLSGIVLLYILVNTLFARVRNELHWRVSTLFEYK